MSGNILLNLKIDFIEFIVVIFVANLLGVISYLHDEKKQSQIYIARFEVLKLFKNTCDH